MAFLFELDIIEGLQGEAEVSQKAVDAEKTDDREISKHSVERFGTVVASHSHWLFVALHCRKLLVDLGSLDKGVQDIENAVAAPGVWVVAKQLDLLLVAGLSRDLVSVGTEVIELVDELVNDIPCPVVLRICQILSSEMYASILTDGGSKSTGPSEFRMKWNKLQ